MRDYIQIFIAFCVFYFLEERIILPFVPKMVVCFCVIFGAYILFDWVLSFKNNNNGKT